MSFVFLPYKFLLKIKWGCLFCSFQSLDFTDYISGDLTSPSMYVVLCGNWKLDQESWSDAGLFFLGEMNSWVACFYQEMLCVCFSFCDIISHRCSLFVSNNSLSATNWFCSDSPVPSSFMNWDATLCPVLITTRLISCGTGKINAWFFPSTY